MEAIQSLAQLGRKPGNAILLSCVDEDDQGDHAFYLDGDYGPFVVRGGLTSGYFGAGPSGLAHVLEMLVELHCWPREVRVSRQFLDRVDQCRLTHADVEHIEEQPSVGFPSFTRYLDGARQRRHGVWAGGPEAIPLGRINARLLPFALRFHDDADNALRDAHRCLEVIVRERIGALAVDKRGNSKSSLWTVAFGGDVPGPLVWPTLGNSERCARVSLFQGASGVFRNSRVHREKTDINGDFEELMLLNLLFAFEAEAVLVS